MRPKRRPHNTRISAPRLVSTLPSATDRGKVNSAHRGHLANKNAAPIPYVSRRAARRRIIGRGNRGENITPPVGGGYAAGADYVTDRLSPDGQIPGGVPDLLGGVFQFLEHGKPEPTIWRKNARPVGYERGLRHRMLRRQGGQIVSRLRERCACVSRVQAEKVLLEPLCQHCVEGSASSPQPAVLLLQVRSPRGLSRPWAEVWNPVRKVPGRLLPPKEAA